MKPLGASTVFHVSDLKRAVAFYSEHLDFEVRRLVEAGVAFHCHLGYGMRDFAVGDPDGNQIGRGEEIRS